MFNFDNTYIKLPESFYQEVKPSSAVQPQLISYNHQLAKSLGIISEGVDVATLAEIYSGKKILEGTQPIAHAYAGHQFGHFVPQLGDGRAILLGEVLALNGQRFDIQLKGAGPTPFSRNGDGCSAIGPVIREYLLSEAMHALKVPTSRALAAVTTGDLVFREAAFPGAILTRTASSHIRVGTFEYFASRNNNEAVKILADYCINRHYPDIQQSENVYLEFLQAVAHRQLSLVSQWMSIGFIHGVMNTDNSSICGETIDFGPCAFMDQFALDKVFSSIDRNGRYAYDQQGQIAVWNLSSLANCLIPIIDPEQDKAITLTENLINSLPDFFYTQWSAEMGKKIGLYSATKEDIGLITVWLKYLHSENLDFTNSFRQLAIALKDNAPNQYFKQTNTFDEFYTTWQKRLEAQEQPQNQAISLMNQTNPVFIPRNHQVERAIQMANNGDYCLFERLNAILSTPFEDQPDAEDYKKLPTKEEEVHQTFCGT